jgi:uncharacterized protein (DUF2342 family)
MWGAGGGGRREATRSPATVLQFQQSMNNRAQVARTYGRLTVNLLTTLDLLLVISRDGIARSQGSRLKKVTDAGA